MGPMTVLTTYGTLVGTTLNNRYQVEEKIGVGGFGSIYRAKQLQMGRDVALKVMNPEMSKDARLVERFRREAQAACNLRDPHTIITYDFDQTPDGVLYMALELLSGQNLFNITEDMERLPPHRVAHIMAQCCSSLGEAHGKGIVHRDIKPENIVLEERDGDPDFVKILDFGIAKIISGDSGQMSSPALTAAGQTLGTLEYMSPEQLMGKDLDGRADIYALGVVAYELLTGELPFEGSLPGEIIKGHMQKIPRPLTQVAPDANIPAELERIVLKMLAKNRDQRYPDVATLRNELRALIHQMGGPAPSSSFPAPAMETAAPKKEKKGKSKLWLILLIVGVAVVAGSVAAYLVIR